jgi:hypothetical protein
MDISIVVKETVVDLHFGTLKELEQWVDKEANFWKWLETIPASINFLWNLPNSEWIRIRKLIKKYENEPEDSKANLLQEIIGTIRNIYSQNRAIPSTSPRAQFIETLRHKDRDVAAFALCSFLRPNEIPLHDPPAIRGIVQGYLFDLGLSNDGAAAEKEALRLLSESWSSFFQVARKKQSEFDQIIADAAANLTQLRKRESEQCEEIRTVASENFKSLEHTFHEKLALLAPVTYWQKKAEKHRNASIVVGIAFIAMGVLTVWLVWAALQHFVIGQINVSSNPSVIILQPEYWRYSIPLGIGTFLLWPMRILARILFSNLHLREDAFERVTMANTYLALSQSKEGLKAEDRKLILEMLFRPSSPGIVHDDAAPPSIVGYLSRAGSGKH